LEDNKDVYFHTTNFVICESFYLLKKKINLGCAINFLQLLSRDHFSVANITIKDSDKIIKLLNQYDDHDIDLADISLVLLAEDLNTGDILTVDDNDFDYLMWNNQPFSKLL